MYILSKIKLAGDEIISANYTLDEALMYIKENSINDISDIDNIHDETDLIEYINRMSGYGITVVEKTYPVIYTMTRIKIVQNLGNIIEPIHDIKVVAVSESSVDSLKILLQRIMDDVKSEKDCYIDANESNDLYFRYKRHHGNGRTVYEFRIDCNGVNFINVDDYSARSVRAGEIVFIK